MTLPTVTATVDLRAVKDHCRQTRESHKRMYRAKPLVRLWANPPTGQESQGLMLRGIAADSIAGSFPFTKKDVATGTLKLRLDHFLAQWMISIPNDTAAKKNVVITVDHMGGRKRWSGLLKSWRVRKDGQGVYFFEATFMDDRLYMQYVLGPPNPALPIPIFQAPRVLPIILPAISAMSYMALIQFMRLNGNWYSLPDDPFRWDSWAAGFDSSQWQTHIACPPLLEDDSLWTVLSTRMQDLETVFTDALDDAKVVLRYRRILTVDGESPSDIPHMGPSTVRNGALVFWFEDSENFYNSDGTAFDGNLFTGFIRSAVQFVSGNVEQTLKIVTDQEGIFPDAYYGSQFWGQYRGYPWVVVRDSKWSQVETSDLAYSPATAVTVIVGGDNPYADQIAELIIQSVGNILGYFALGGFSSAGDIAASVIMPFLVGTIFAWDRWKNTSRAQELGFVHLYEVFQQGADSNAWSLAALRALRSGFEATSAKSSHVFTMYGVGPIYPGLHIHEGERIGSTAEKIVPGTMFVDSIEEMNLSWDYGSKDPHKYTITVGQSEALMSIAERQSRAISKSLSVLQDIGVRMVT